MKTLYIFPLKTAVWKDKKRIFASKAVQMKVQDLFGENKKRRVVTYSSAALHRIFQAENPAASEEICSHITSKS